MFGYVHHGPNSKILIEKIDFKSLSSDYLDLNNVSELPETAYKFYVTDGTNLKGYKNVANFQVVHNL